MKSEKVQQLQHGLYKIYWKSGGSSLASVGSDSDGKIWMAPTNWTSGSTAERTSWKMVKKVKLIDSFTIINPRKH